MTDQIAQHIVHILAHLKGKDLENNFQRMRPHYGGTDMELRVAILNAALTYYIQTLRLQGETPPAPDPTLDAQETPAP